MKRIITAVVMLAALGVMTSMTSCRKENTNVVPDTTNTITQPQNASDYEKERLLFLREEEKMARDVYQTLYAQWSNLNFLSNITSSEQKHMDAVKGLLDTYGIEDPVGNNAVGIFTNTEIQKLYDDLTHKGLQSEMDAIEVGLTIEDMDIYDLQVSLQSITQNDITTIFNNLMKASKNHMREFYSQYTSRGGTYTPQYITQQEYDEIVSTPKEHGGGNGNGGM